MLNHKVITLISSKNSKSGKSTVDKAIHIKNLLYAILIINLSAQNANHKIYLKILSSTAVQIFSVKIQ